MGCCSMKEKELQHLCRQSSLLVDVTCCGVLAEEKKCDYARVVNVERYNPPHQHLLATYSSGPVWVFLL
jgi:hypothetical protein